ncbi:MAG TPA: phosphatase PAP2 family protein [Tepidisphaeraceae bacterium]|nr:phosphatase PAP2 family protein [Tepidisphaeraceae bacterium]
MARWLHENGRDLWFDQLAVKRPLMFAGEAWFIAIGLFHAWRWRGAGFIALCVLVSGSHVVLKWSVGRTRPFEHLDYPGELLPFHFDFFRDGIIGFFDQRRLSFPSGHTATAFALAASLSIMCPRYRWIFYTVASLTGLQRISQNAHWVSDTVFAAIFGMGVTYGVLWCITTLQQRAIAPARAMAPASVS